MWQQLPSHLARLLESADGLPEEVRVDSQRLLSALQPLCDRVQVLLLYAPLRRLNEARADLEQKLGSPPGIGPSLPEGERFGEESQVEVVERQGRPPVQYPR